MVTHTHIHTHTHDNYYNPRCAHAHRGLMSFDPDRNYLRKWIEIDPDRIWFGTMSVQVDATEVDLFEPT